MLNIKIVSDSSGDLHTLEGADFAVAPLKIVTSEKEYVDDTNLDLRGMLDDLKAYSGKSGTSCPNADDYLAAFGDAQYVFCITITATLSGSYNAARLAAEMYMEAHPDRKVYVCNSLSTGPEMALIMEKVKELAATADDFDALCADVQKYAEKTGLLFMLESIRNLANNGRVSPIVAKMAGFLGIRMVGKASDQGDLEPLHKCRGEKKALQTMVSEFRNLGYNGGKLFIGHACNENAANELAGLMKEAFGELREVRVYSLGGLCCFYAEEGGLIVGFEKA